MTYYWDTSALAKVYHREPGTDTMLGLYASGEFIQLSELARIELLATAMRKFRENILDERAFIALRERFQADIQGRYGLLRFSSLVVEETERVLTTHGLRHPLRTLDAIQLAFYNVYCEEDTVFVSADIRLLSVLEGEKRPFLNP